MLPSSCMWCMIWCFMAVKMRTSVPPWLLLEATGSLQHESQLPSEQDSTVKKKKKKARSRQESQSSYNLTMDVIGHRLHHSFYLLSVALNPANTKEKGTKQGCDYQESGLTGGHFGGCLSPQRIFVIWWEGSIKKGSECRREERRRGKSRGNPGTEPSQSLIHCSFHCPFMTACTCFWSGYI